MSKFGWVSLVLALTLGLTVAGMSCTAKPAELSPAEFYKTKTIDFAVGGSAGASLDRVGRVLGPVLQKHLGAPVIVINKGGGGGTEAAEHAWFAEPDGTHLGILGPESILLPALANPGLAKYEVDKFGYIFAFPPDVTMLFVAENGPYNTLDKVKAGRNMLFGVALPYQVWGLVGVSTIDILGLNAKILPGWQAGDIGLKVAQGELAGGLMSATQGPAMRGIKPVLAFGNKRSSLYPDIPALGDLVKPTDPTHKHLLELAGSILVTNRAIWTGPNVPEARLKYLRTTFVDKVLPEAKADLENVLKIQIDLKQVWAGEDIAKAMTARWKEKDDLKPIFDKLIQKYRQ